MATEQVMTPEQVAQFLQVTPETVYRYIRQGKLVASKIGRQYRIPRRNVEVLLAATSTVPLRTYSWEKVQEFLREDEIDEDTRRKAERLLANLRQ